MKIDNKLSAPHIYSAVDGVHNLAVAAALQKNGRVVLWRVMIAAWPRWHSCGFATADSNSDPAGLGLPAL